MKRIIHALTVSALILSLALPLSGCTAQEEDERLQVVTTIFPQYDFVRQIAGDAVSATMLLPPGGESHAYEPTPGDMRRVAECDLFIGVGGPSEHWAAELLDSLDREKRTLYLLDIVEPVDEELVEGMETEAEEEEEIDEHVWTSPRNAARIVSAICDELCALDPANEPLFRANAEIYLDELEALDTEFCEIVAGGARHTVVFGERFPFRYLADAYGLDYYAAFPGCSAETEPAPATVAFLIGKVKDEQIPVVFTIEFSTGTVADAICEATGARRLEMHSCHNLSAEDFSAGVTYLTLMRRNAEALREALK